MNYVRKLENTLKTKCKNFRRSKEYLRFFGIKIIYFRKDLVMFRDGSYFTKNKLWHEKDLKVRRKLD